MDNPSSGNAPRERPRDPVCGMEATDAVSFAYDGRTYFFCSDHCRERFEKDPTAYIRGIENG